MMRTAKNPFQTRNRVVTLICNHPGKSVPDEHLNNQDADSDNGSGLSYLLKGMLWGGFLMLGAVTIFSVNRLHKQEMIFDGELGNIRISQEALESLISSHCERVCGVLSVETEVHILHREPKITLQVALERYDEPTGKVIGEVVSAAHCKVQEILSLSPSELSITVDKFKNTGDH